MSAKTLSPTFYVTYIAGFLIQTIWLYFFQKNYLTVRSDSRFFEVDALLGSLPLVDMGCLSRIVPAAVVCLVYHQ